MKFLFQVKEKLHMKRRFHMQSRFLRKFPLHYEATISYEKNIAYAKLIAYAILTAYAKLIAYAIFFSYEKYISYENLTRAKTAFELIWVDRERPGKNGNNRVDSLPNIPYSGGDMNRPAEKIAESNGFVNFAKACERYATSKAKLRQLVADGLLSCHTSDLDRRAKLLSLEELNRLFDPKAGK